VDQITFGADVASNILREGMLALLPQGMHLIAHGHVHFDSDASSASHCQFLLSFGQSSFGFLNLHFLFLENFLERIFKASLPWRSPCGTFLDL
jgi:hypothetical protein